MIFVLLLALSLLLVYSVFNIIHSLKAGTLEDLRPRMLPEDEVTTPPKSYSPPKIDKRKIRRMK